MMKRMCARVHETLQLGQNKRYRRLARISHQPSAATADTLADTALRSVGLLNVLSYTFPGASVARLVSAASPPFRLDGW
jgi:hypothetical protein